MKQNLYHPKTGELSRIHHHDAQGWINDGWLTAPPDLESIAQKKKTKSTPVEESTPIEEQT
jgi:hypothetical protein